MVVEVGSMQSLEPRKLSFESCLLHQPRVARGDGFGHRWASVLALLREPLFLFSESIPAVSPNRDALPGVPPSGCYCCQSHSNFRRRSPDGPTSRSHESSLLDARTSFWAYFVGFALIPGALSLAMKTYWHLASGCRGVNDFSFCVDDSHSQVAQRPREAVALTILLRDLALSAGALAFATTLTRAK